MGSYSEVSVARVVHSSQGCCTPCIGGDIAFTSSPAPSRRSHRMLNFPGVILIEKMEQRFRTDILSQSS